MSDSVTPDFSQAGNVFEQPGSIELATADDTREFGAQLGATLTAGDVVILSGGLGAGKTTLTQGIAKGMDVRGRVTSPTFTIARVHRARRADAPDLVHVDAYRLLGESAHQTPDATTDKPATGQPVPGESAADPWGELDALDLDTDLDTSVVVAEWGAGLVEALTRRYLLVELDRETFAAQDPESETRIITWHWAEH